MVGVARTMAPFFAGMGISNMGSVMEGGEFDPNNTSLYIGGIGAVTTEEDLRLALEPYGQINSVKLIPKSRCAFVDFKDRLGAEAAFTGCGGTVAIGSARLVCSVNWSRSKARHSHSQDAANTSGMSMGIPPPPGVNAAGGKGSTHAPAAAMYYPSASGAMEGSAPKIKK